MRKLLIIVAIIVSVVVVFSGCHYDKKDLVYPKTTCDTSNLTYSGFIESIISKNCYACHAGLAANANGTVRLDSYSALRARASSGNVMHRITTKDPSMMMPKGGPPLSDCDITKIDLWIKRGVPQ